MVDFQRNLQQNPGAGTSGDKVPSKFAKSLLRLVMQRGYDVMTSLDYAGIDFNPLDVSNPHYRDEITAMQYTRLYQHVLSILQDESFGLLGKGVTPGAFRMMCYCIIHCENLGKALYRASEFFRIFYEEPFHIRLAVQGGLAHLGYESASELNIESSVLAGDAYGLSAWHRLCAWMIGRMIELQEVHFIGKRPDNAKKFENLFGCELRFEQKKNQIVFDSSYLEYPLVHTEQSLKDFLRTAPYQLLVMNSEQENSGLVAQVRNLMGHDFSQGFPSFEEISYALNMSAPTLRRRLKREGTNYQQLKDDCRRDAAIAYLSRPELSINAVAALMGFTDPSAFHRSFKKWTGIPPGQFRAREFADDSQ